MTLHTPLEWTILVLVILGAWEILKSPGGGKGKGKAKGTKPKTPTGD